jgi:hypothetical protein
MRAAPGHRSELVSQAIMGTPVRVLKVDQDWLLIQTPDRYIGWTDEAAIQCCSREELVAWVSSTKVVYTGHNGIIWDSPDMSQPVSDITTGSMVRLAGETEGFFAVGMPDKRSGFIRKSEALPFDIWMANHDLSGTSIVQTAMKFLGHPYLWGGTSANGFDCSGFTKTVFFLNGVVLPRDADQQAGCGEAISTVNNFALLTPGDLLFFGSAAPGGGKAHITHTGIYTGDLEFIHSSGRVWLDSFDPAAENYNDYRKNTLITVRRVIREGSLIGAGAAIRITDNDFYQDPC